jgi:hypothetical protein
MNNRFTVTSEDCKYCAQLLPVHRIVLAQIYTLKEFESDLCEGQSPDFAKNRIGGGTVEGFRRVLKNGQ